MPSMWPFSREDTSPASFEKALSKLSAQITASTVSLEGTRTNARRWKGLWTLWGALIYLVATLILTLVLGPQQWGLPHYVGILGAPFLIFGIRKVLSFFYNWKTDRQQSYVNRLVKERDQKIAQLKLATKYDTTQQLLEKYGGSSSKPKSQGDQPKQQRKAVPSNPKEGKSVARTGISPPATANIPRQSLPRQHSPQNHPAPSPPQSPVPDFTPDEPGFAPNAFPPSFPSVLNQPSSTPTSQTYQRRWSDRILDVLLGEDETLASNRIVLLCAHCRLVNGQAPPGTRSLAEIGRWRCGSCGGWNGQEKKPVSASADIMNLRREKEEEKRNDAEERGTELDREADKVEVSLQEDTKEGKDGIEDAENPVVIKRGRPRKSITPEPEPEAEDEDDEESDDEEVGETENEPDSRAIGSVAERVTRSRRGRRSRI